MKLVLVPIQMAMAMVGQLRRWLMPQEKHKMKPTACSASLEKRQSGNKSNSVLRWGTINPALHSILGSEGSKEAGPVKFRGFPSCDGEGKGRRKGGKSDIVTTIPRRVRGQRMGASSKILSEVGDRLG